MDWVCFYRIPPPQDILSTIIQLEKTILQLDRYGDIIREVMHEQKNAILAHDSPKWKKRMLLHRRKMLLSREEDMLALKNRLFTLLLAIQHGVCLDTTIKAVSMANSELKKLHIENIESAINQMDDLVCIQAEQTDILSRDIRSENDLDEQLRILDQDISLPLDISLPPCPTKIPTEKKHRISTLV